MFRFRRAVAALVVAVCVALVGSGCVQTQDPLPTASARSTAPRPFTVLTMQKGTTTDPAAIHNDTDSMVVLDLFQRLMLVQPTTGLLKPDLAKECLYTAATVFECSLPKDITFSSGHPLTSHDVKFSITRAMKLAPERMTMLSALRSIETPDAQTVRFRLKYPDNQFGFGLATAASSIVDAEAYDPDKVRPTSQMPLGSGPYSLDAWDDKGLTIVKYADYAGPLGTDMPRIRITWSDSATAEEALRDGDADIVWRTLSDAAVNRLEGRIQEQREQGRLAGYFRWPQYRFVLQRLVWLPSSSQRSNAELRRAIALALQPDRTASSILPSVIDGHADAFDVGGDPTLPTVPEGTTLTMRFTDSSPTMQDLANQVRGRLESELGITIRLVTANQDADLELRDSLPQVNTALGWLQDYLLDPLPGSAGKLEQLEERIRSSSREEVQLPALTEIQKQAAADDTVVPIAEVNGVLFMSDRTTLVGEAFGPGWQLALWGVRWRS